MAAKTIDVRDVPPAERHPKIHDILTAEYGDRVEWEYVDQCGCGGHVVRVHV